MTTPRMFAAAVLLVTLSVAVAGSGDPPRRDAALAHAVRRVAAIREADRIVVARVAKVHETPGVWCGILATRQEVTYEIVESLYGGPADGEVRVGHLLVSGSSLVSKDAPFLRPEIFHKGARFLLCLSRDDERRWLVRDESYGATPIDPPAKADPKRGTILRKLLFLLATKGYLHPESAGRVPVIVALTDEIGVPPDLEMFDERVRFYPDGVIRKSPHLRVTEWTVRGDMTTVRFRYDAEGVTGEAEFRREGGEYRLVKSEVHER